MSTPSYASIVWVEIPDSGPGTNFEEHPAVIITPTDQIVPGGNVRVVGISTKTGLAPPEVQVELPWHPQGQTKTKLTKPCSAVCTWVHTICLDDVRKWEGYVPGKYMIRINELVKQLGTAGTPPPASGGS